MLGAVPVLSEMDTGQRTRAGAVAFLLGVALVVLLVYVPMRSLALQVLVGGLAVLLLAVGTIALGISRRGV